MSDGGVRRTLLPRWISVNENSIAQEREISICRALIDASVGAEARPVSRTVPCSFG